MHKYYLAKKIFHDEKLSTPYCLEYYILEKELNHSFSYGIKVLKCYECDKVFLTEEKSFENLCNNKEVIFDIIKYMIKLSVTPSDLENTIEYIKTNHLLDMA